MVYARGSAAVTVPAEFIVVCAIYPRVTELDFTGPNEVFWRLPGEGKLGTYPIIRNPRSSGRATDEGELVIDLTTIKAHGRHNSPIASAVRGFRDSMSARAIRPGVQVVPAWPCIRVA